MRQLELIQKELRINPYSRKAIKAAEEKMKRSLRFYQNSTTEQDAQKVPMYGIRNAYGTINCFLFEGTKSEKARVREGKALHPELLDHVPSLLEVMRWIFFYFSNSSMTGQCCERTVYRTERAAGAEEIMRKGATVSLTSTSKGCELPEYLFKKEGLCLLKFHLPQNIPYIDVNAVLTEGNAHEEEQEILLPPFLEVRMNREEDSANVFSTIIYENRLYDIMGLEKEFYDYYPADLGHPEYEEGESITAYEFKDPGVVKAGELRSGMEFTVEFMTVDADRAVWMPVKLTVNKVWGKDTADVTPDLNGYTGKGMLYVTEGGLDRLVIIVKRNPNDPVWKTKRKTPDRLYRIREKNKDQNTN